MDCLFGEVVNGQMILNKYGQIAHNEWLKTPEVRNDVELGEFIIMPNHMHAIIRRGESNSPIPPESNSPIPPESNSPPPTESNSESMTSQMEISCSGKTHSRPKGTSNTIGAIVRGYKTAVTRQLNALNIGRVVWQRNYYEIIIRDESAYNNISNYIINNPKKWNGDRFHKK
ncbi:MAG: hypothetical protein OEW75_09385 [Cyclobacteriaceae bacterium]|nr:hypothetical protein [Cyclobacteriaceae bacterium]